MKHILKILCVIAVRYIIVWQFIQQNNYKNFDDYLPKKRTALSTNDYKKFLGQKNS